MKKSTPKVNFEKLAKSKQAKDKAVVNQSKINK